MLPGGIRWSTIPPDYLDRSAAPSSGARQKFFGFNVKKIHLSVNLLTGKVRVATRGMTSPPLFGRSSSQRSSAHPEGEVPAKARACDMILEDKSRRRQAERVARNGHRHSQKFRSRKVCNVDEGQEQEAQEQVEQAKPEIEPEEEKPEIEPEEESELLRVRERKTSEAAELLSNALGTEGVALLLKAFSEEEQPHDLLSALRRRLQIAMAVKNGT